MKKRSLQEIKNNNPVFILKKLYTGIILAAFCSLSFAQVGLEGIVVEKIAVTSDANDADPSLPLDAFAYRVFVDLATGWEMQNVFSLATHEMRISTTTVFYNYENGVSMGRSMTNGTFNDPAGRNDSYITIDGVTSTRVGMLVSEDTIDGTPDGYTTGTSISPITLGEDFDIPFLDVPFSGTFSTYSGIYGVNGGETGTTESNSVLIGQFTTNGVFSFELNMQIRKVGTGTTEQYVAKNPLGVEFLYDGLTYPSATTPPSVSINNPLNGFSFSTGESVSIEASAIDADGQVTSVDFLINGVSIGSDTETPYQISWIGVEGLVKITAVAHDNLGFSATSEEIEITIVPLGAPQVNISSPSPSASFVVNEPVVITADASDSDGLVTLVEFYVNSLKVGEDNSSPYSYTWTPVTHGSADIYAIATDDDNLTTTSETISVLVGPNSINAKFTDGSFQAYPVPVIDLLTIEMSTGLKDKQFQFSVIDICGMVCLSKNIFITNENHSEQIDMKSLKKGLYFIKISNNSGAEICKKIVKY
jgi:hypothetical protein